MALARVDGEIGANFIKAIQRAHTLVEAVFANELCRLQPGTMEQIKLIDVRAQSRATASFVFSSAALFIGS